MFYIIISYVNAASLSKYLLILYSPLVFSWWWEVIKCMRRDKVRWMIQALGGTTRLLVTWQLVRRRITCSEGRGVTGHSCNYTSPLAMLHWEFYLPAKTKTSSLSQPLYAWDFIPARGLILWQINQSSCKWLSSWPILLVHWMFPHATQFNTDSNWRLCCK